MANAAKQQPPARPRPVGVITGVVALESLALALTGVLLAGSLFAEHALPAGGIVFAAVVLLAAAVWLGAAARDTWRGMRWPRAAILVSQAFLVIVGFSMFQAGARVAGAACVVAAGITLACLFTADTGLWMHGTTRD